MSVSESYSQPDRDTGSRPQVLELQYSGDGTRATIFDANAEGSEIATRWLTVNKQTVVNTRDHA